MSKRQHLRKCIIRRKGGFRPKILQYKVQDSSDQWVMRQLNETAAPIRVAGNRVHLGFPKISTKLYPRQTMRVNTGWNLDALPQDSFLTTVPSDTLQTAGLLALPKSVHAQEAGSEIVQQIQNNSQFPI